MEDTALLLDVLGEAVRNDAVDDAEHGHVVPLPTLDSMDRRHRDAERIALGVKGLAQPRRERRRLGVEVGDGDQAVEVVEVARPLTAAGAVEEAHRRPETDGVADDLEDVSSRTGTAGIDDESEVVGEIEHLGTVLLGNLLTQCADRFDSPRASPGDALGEPLGQTARRPPQDLDDVGGGEATGIDGDAEVGQSGAQPSAGQEIWCQDGVEWDVRGAERDMRGEQDRVDPSQHGDRHRFDARLGEPSGDDAGDRFGAIVGAVLDDAQRPGRRVVVRPGDDLLGDAPIVVAEQCRRGRYHLGGAAVVDTQGVFAGARKQGAVVDQEARVGSGVPVDALVVVADPEDVETRQAEQADQQHVGRREILELVDEQVAAAPLQLGSERAVGENRLDRRIDLLVEVDDTAISQAWRGSGETVHRARRRRPAMPRPPPGRAARDGSP